MGNPIGILLGMHKGYGVYGFWIGIDVTLFVSSVILLINHKSIFLSKIIIMVNLQKLIKNLTFEIIKIWL